MTVINSDMISDKVTRHDVLPMSFLKKSAYTGSKRGLRYKMLKHVISPENEDGDEKTVLRCYVWEGRFAFDATPDEEKKSKDFTFDDKGIDDAIEYINSFL